MIRSSVRFGESRIAANCRQFETDLPFRTLLRKVGDDKALQPFASAGRQYSLETQLDPPVISFWSCLSQIGVSQLRILGHDSPFAVQASPLSFLVGTTRWVEEACEAEVKGPVFADRLKDGLVDDGKDARCVVLSRRQLEGEGQGVAR